MVVTAGSLPDGLVSWVVSDRIGNGGKTSATGWRMVWIEGGITDDTGTATVVREALTSVGSASGTLDGCLRGEGEVGTGVSLRLFTDECLRWRLTLGEERGRREGERCGERED